jgi:hypothetical protein
MGPSRLDRDLESLGRTQYHLSGRVNFAQMILNYPLALAGAAAIGGGLWFLQHVGFYFIMLAALFAGFGAWGIMFALVHFTHCRNPVIAVLAALPIGLVAYVGQFQADIIEQGGWQFAHRVDLLPVVIQSAWENQVIAKAGREGQPQYYGNMLVSIAELVMVVVMAGYGAYSTATRVYAEDSCCWAKSSKKVLTPDAAALIEEGIRTGTLDSVIPSLRIQMIPDPQNPPPRCNLTLEYVVDGDVYCGYLTVDHQVKSAVPVVRQLRLTDDELASCRPLFQA